MSLNFKPTKDELDKLLGIFDKMIQEYYSSPLLKNQSKSESYYVEIKNIGVKINENWNLIQADLRKDRKQREAYKVYEKHVKEVRMQIDQLNRTSLFNTHSRQNSGIKPDDSALKRQDSIKKEDSTFKKQDSIIRRKDSVVQDGFSTPEPVIRELKFEPYEIDETQYADNNKKLGRTLTQINASKKLGAESQMELDRQKDKLNLAGTNVKDMDKDLVEANGAMSEMRLTQLRNNAVINCGYWLCVFIALIL